ncbi:MAG: hypothetical protein [Circular genetic element sp.]|nr:MAG: hypothetical protein [Circular genetic element sp.]
MALPFFAHAAVAATHLARGAIGVYYVRSRFASPEMDEVNTYQSTEDSMEGMVPAINRIVGDDTEQYGSYRGYHWDINTLNYKK